MTGTILNDVRRGYYADSVALMRLSQTITRVPGVQDAALMMGTPANIDILADANLLTDAGRQADGGDLIIAVRADDVDAANTAMAEAAGFLAQSRTGEGSARAWRPKTIRAAVNAMQDANLALISVPGDFAIAEARKAIRRGLDAMIFSDNVAVADEAALKREAQELGRLVMGPDCGTAIINGTPLAFANRVRRGSVGIIGASGTGIQEVSCLIDRFGGGVSHAIGVGGRDLSREVGGLSTLMAVDMLDADPATESLVLISKPPPADLAAQVLERVSASRKPATICFIGADDLSMPGNATQVATLLSAAEHAVSTHQLDRPPPHVPRIAVPPGRRCVQGLYSGGTLCAEAQVIFRSAAEAFSSNAPIPGSGTSTNAASAHALLDLGADEFTKGKPHPMIDPSVRDRALIDALASEQAAVILLDVVIGYGSHYDPAGHLVGVLDRQSRPDRPAIIASVTGTDADPQNRTSQVAKLESAGVHVAPTNAEAATWALTAIANET